MLYNISWMFAGKARGRICFPGTFSCEMAPRKRRASEGIDSKWMHSSFFFPCISQFWFTAINADALTHIPQRSILMLHVEFMVKHLPTSIKSHKLKSPHHPGPLRSDWNELLRFATRAACSCMFCILSSGDPPGPPPSALISKQN